MRGRLGSRIGASLADNTSGLWRLADVHAAKVGGYGFKPGGFVSPWPTRNITIGWPISGYPSYSAINYADATEGGSATFNASVLGDSSLSGAVLSYYWQRSTNSGSTWSTVSGSSGTFTFNSFSSANSYANAYLTRTGQTIANDGELYRLVVLNGLKAVTGPSGTLRYDTVTLSIGHPSSDTLAVGQYTYFIAQGYATGNTYGRTYYGGSYQWQRSTDSGSTWVDFSGGSTGYLQFRVVSGDNGYMYRCRVTVAGQTLFTNAATLTVT
jgi:hypothetical protein